MSSEKERRLESKYPALDNANGVRLLLSDYHALLERQYAGDYDAVVILVDLATAIERAGLTDRQREALRLVYGEDLTQEMAGERMGVRRVTVARLQSIAETKISRIYESWARHGEGYSISNTEGER